MAQGCHPWQPVRTSRSMLRVELRATGAHPMQATGRVAELIQEFLSEL